MLSMPSSDVAVEGVLELASVPHLHRAIVCDSFFPDECDAFRIVALRAHGECAGGAYPLFVPGPYAPSAPSEKALRKVLP